MPEFFGPFFNQVKVPKIGNFLLKTDDLCMFFVIIFIKITIIIINGTFSVLGAKRHFDVRKNMTKLHELEGGS